MAGNNANVVFNNLASIYSAIEQYDPYGDNSFLAAVGLTMLFITFMAYLGVTVNANEMESLFPLPYPNPIRTFHGIPCPLPYTL